MAVVDKDVFVPNNGNYNLGKVAAMPQLEKRQAGAEIEVTPEMIDAGVKEWCEYEDGICVDWRVENLVARIFREVARKSPNDQG